MPSSIEQAVLAANAQVLGPRPALSSATSTATQLARGAAYQAVAESSALALQQAAAVMSNVGVVSAAAMALIAEKMVENPPVNIPVYSPCIPQIASIAAWSITYFTAASAAAAAVAASYPSS